MPATSWRISDFSQGAQRGAAGYFDKLIAGKDFNPNTYVKNAYDDITRWATKSSKLRSQIIAAAEDGLQTILTQAVDHYQQHHLVYNAAVELNQFVYTHGILHDLEARLQAYKREHDLMLISDAPMFLRDIIGQDDTPFVYEKIGTTFQHFLIDEFQDTSGLQWANFKPLVENSLNSGHRNLVVGDVKQSIYRWRGGDWQLLLEKIQQDVPGYHTEVRNLDKNYRSRQHIVNFNNVLFAQLSQLLYQTIEEKLNKVEDEGMRQLLMQRAQITRAAYQQVHQSLPADYQETWHGHVRLQLLEPKQLIDGVEVSWKEHVKGQLPGMIETLQDQGYRLQDIAFLVRNKREGQEIANTLMEYKQQEKARAPYRYEVISPESLFLNASLTVGLLIDVLRFLDDAADQIAQRGVMYKYQRLRQLPIDSETLHAIFAADSEERATGPVLPSTTRRLSVVRRLPEQASPLRTGREPYTAI